MLILSCFFTANNIGYRALHLVLTLPIAGRTAILSVWLIREALWWWTITMMIALVVGLLARSEMGRRVFGRTLALAAGSRLRKHQWTTAYSA